jgi:histidyl-tRNA synthetase
MVVEILQRVGLNAATPAALISSELDPTESKGVEGFHLILNSVGCKTCRPKFMDTLRERLKDVAPTMCADCQRRATTNPLRVLDCKVPDDQATIDTLPSILDHLCEECHQHFQVVQEHLHHRSIAFEIKARLVRGLDYYMRTTFEITHGALGAQNSVLGGGRYDGLAESIGSKIPAPGIGFSIGEDRLVMSVGEESQPVVDVYLAPMGEAAEKMAGTLAAELRAAGISVERSVDRKLKRALEVANKMGARYALILGDNEIAAGTYLVKDMTSGEQVTLSRDELAEHVRLKTN